LNQDFRGKGSSLGNIFGLYKTRHILLSESANCTVLRAVVLTHYRRVTDGRTDRIAVPSTSLVMRALRRAVKTTVFNIYILQFFYYIYFTDVYNCTNLYGFVKTNGSHIEILLPVSIFCESHHRRRSYDVVKIFKMTAVDVANQLPAFGSVW